GGAVLVEQAEEVGLALRLVGSDGAAGAGAATQRVARGAGGGDGRAWMPDRDRSRRRHGDGLPHHGVPQGAKALLAGTRRVQRGEGIDTGAGGGVAGVELDHGDTAPAEHGTGGRRTEDVAQEPERARPSAVGGDILLGRAGILAAVEGLGTGL